MAYIGASPTTSAFVTDTFNGNGSTVAFTMSVAPANTTSIIVAVSGVLQDPSTYSVSGTTLTFSAAPPSGTGNISVRFLGIPASGVTSTAYRTQTEFTATAGQTTFSVPSYTVGYIDVYRNGVLLGSADFTATSGTTVVLTNPASSGDLVETVSFYVSSVLNAIPAQNNAVIDSYILSMAGSKLTGTQVIPSAALPIGSVLQVGKFQTGTLATGSTAIPFDNTIPQITEGDEYMSLAFTPKFSTSTLKIDVVFQGTNPVVSTNGFVVALFMTGTSDALAATFNSTTNDSISNFLFTHYMTSGTTSAITFKVRAGSGTSATTSFNGQSGSAKGGGVLASSITISEIADD